MCFSNTVFRFYFFFTVLLTERSWSSRSIFVRELYNSPHDIWPFSLSVNSLMYSYNGPPTVDWIWSVHPMGEPRSVYSALRGKVFYIAIILGYEMVPDQTIPERYCLISSFWNIYKRFYETLPKIQAFCFNSTFPEHLSSFQLDGASKSGFIRYI